VTFRRTEADGVHTYSVKSTSIRTLVRDAAAGTATVLATARVRDITIPERPVVLLKAVTLRVSVDDNGTPGAGADTIGVTVLDPSSVLWFSSEGGLPAVQRPIDGGNIQVR
jgi:hypothetical protein